MLGFIFQAVDMWPFVNVPRGRFFKAGTRETRRVEFSLGQADVWSMQMLLFSKQKSYFK